jgi:hypothetical protein
MPQPVTVTIPVEPFLIVVAKQWVCRLILGRNGRDYLR